MHYYDIVCDLTRIISFTSLDIIKYYDRGVFPVMFIVIIIVWHLNPDLKLLAFSY